MYALFTSNAYQLVDNKYSSGNEFNAEYIQHIYTYKFHLSSGLYVLHSWNGVSFSTSDLFLFSSQT